MATWKQIEAARERRLWIKDVIIPTAYIGWVIHYLTPEETKNEIKMKVKNKYNCVKAKLKWRKKDEA